MPLVVRVALLTELLERRVRRKGRRNAERQIVDFYCRSQHLVESGRKTETDTNSDASRYSVSWPTVRQMLVRRTIEAWGYDASVLSADVLSAAELNDTSKNCRDSFNVSDVSELARP